MTDLPVPPKESIIYEDERLYVCLALYPMTNGHTIVVWKDVVKDIKSLSCEEYDYLMNIVDVTRDTLLEVLGVQKVYMVYIDEVKHVHWHLVPRYDEKGFNIFSHNPHKTDDFSLQNKMKDMFKMVIKKHSEFNEN
ncbi:HIT family protein [Patescibacteria group bacterium]|nr:MAG: HIT family protein [Patescibacteria group bacterium]